jgi:hypothetical protein
MSQLEDANVDLWQGEKQDENSGLLRLTWCQYASGVGVQQKPNTDRLSCFPNPNNPGNKW